MNPEIMLHRRTIVVLQQVRIALAAAEIPALLRPVDALLIEHQARLDALRVEAFDAEDTVVFRVSKRP